VEQVREIRRFLSGLKGLTTRLESDHILNLLMELRGDLPGDLDRLVAICDEFLALPPAIQIKFMLARRMGWMGRLADADQVSLDPGLERVVQELQKQGLTPEQALAELRARMV
jgi:hypothetical protein